MKWGRGYVHRPGCRAVTLVELLVSMAIVSSMLLALFFMTNSASLAWRNTEKRIDAYREARAALFFMTQDIQTAVVSDLTPFWVNPSESLVPISGDPPPLEHGSRLFFVTARERRSQADGENHGKLCLVGYYLSYSNGAYRLHRYFRSSDETFKRLRLHFDDPGTHPLFTGVVGTLTGDEVLARHVIDFKVTPYRIDWTTQDPWPEDERPAFVELRLRAFNEAAAALFNSPSDWWDENHPAYRDNVETFIARVPMDPR